MKKTVETRTYLNLITDIASLIEQGRKVAVRYVNTALVATYWLMGRRIIEYEQKGKERAKYGKALLKRLSIDLTQRFGKGWGEPHLRAVRQFYLTYGDIEKRYTLCNQAGESGKSEIRHTVCSELVAIDLKVGEFTHADAEQMNLYLNYLKDQEKFPEENNPVGLILCSDKNKTIVEYALGGMSNKIFTSKYRLQLPAPEILKAEIEHERQRLLEMKIVKDENCEKEE